MAAILSQPQCIKYHLLSLAKTLLGHPYPFWDKGAVCITFNEVGRNTKQDMMTFVSINGVVPKGLMDTQRNYGMFYTNLVIYLPLLFQKPKSWVAANLAALYWRVQGQAEQAINCIKVAYSHSKGEQRVSGLVERCRLPLSPLFLNYKLVMSHDGHYWDYCADTRSFGQASANYLKLHTCRCHILVKFTQLIWKSGTRRNLRVPDFQMSYTDLTGMRGCHGSYPWNSHQVACSIFTVLQSHMGLWLLPNL